MWPYEEMRIKLGKKFIILTGPRNQGHFMPHRTKGEIPVRWQKTRMQGKSKSEPSLGFPWER